MNGRAFQFRDSQEGLGRFFLALVVFFAAFLLEIRLAAVIPIEPSFLLAALIALTFFLDFWEVLFLGLLAALFLGYQPVLRPESILVAILPLLMAGARRIIFPFTGWLSNFFGLLAALLLWYGILNFSESLRDPGLLGMDLLLSSLFGFLIFQFCRYGYSETAH